MTTRQPPVLDLIITRDIQGAEIGRNSFNAPIYGPTTTHKVWAARRDSPVGDDLKYNNGLTVAVLESVYVVRAGVAVWKVGDRFTDEEGSRRTVEGIAQLGRSHLELHAKRVG